MNTSPVAGHRMLSFEPISVQLSVKQRLTAPVTVTTNAVDSALCHKWSAQLAGASGSDAGIPYMHSDEHEQWAWEMCGVIETTQQKKSIVTNGHGCNASHAHHRYDKHCHLYAIKHSRRSVNATGSLLLNLLSFCHSRHIQQPGSHCSHRLCCTAK